MHKWLLNGFLASSFTVMVGGMVASAFPASRSLGAGMVAGAASTISATVVTRQSERRLREKISQEIQQINSNLQGLNCRLIDNQSQLKRLDSEFQQSQNNLLKKELVTIAESLHQDHALELESKSKTTVHISTTENISDLTAWFAQRQIKVESSRQPQDADKVFNRIATFLGDNYASLAALHQQMKRSIAERSNLSFSLAGKSQKEIANCTSFCKSLHDSSFLSSYSYSKNQKRRIQATLQQRGDIINFLNGEWLERYIYQKAVKLIHERNLKLQCLINPQIVFPNEDKFGLDLVFLIDQQVFWIECKSGKDYNRYLPLYSNHRKLFGLSPECTFLTIVDLPDAQASSLNKLWNITLLNLDNFDEQFGKALDLILQSSKSKKIDAQSLKVTSTHLSSIFKKKRLQPLPEIRRKAIVEIVEIIDTNQALNSQEIKNKLAERLQIPSSKALSIMKALMRSGCLQSALGRPVTMFQENVVMLSTSDIDSLEKKCIESYATLMLSVDPNYFNKTENVQEFEATVKGKLPDTEVLEQIKARFATSLNSVCSSQSKEVKKAVVAL